MKSLSIAIAALLATSTQAKEVEDGRCPMQPGEIASRVAQSLEYKKLQGSWIDLYDEKELADQFLCMSAKFL